MLVKLQPTRAHAEGLSSKHAACVQHTRSANARRTSGAPKVIVLTFADG